MFTLLSIILRYCKETSTMQNTCFGHFYPIFLGHLSHFKWLFMPIAIRMSGMNALYDIQLTIIVPLTASWVGFKIVSYLGKLTSVILETIESTEGWPSDISSLSCTLSAGHSIRFLFVISPFFSNTECLYQHSLLSNATSVLIPFFNYSIRFTSLAAAGRLLIIDFSI